MGRTPLSGGTAFRFLPAEVGDMEKALDASNGSTPARVIVEGLAEKFTNSIDRSGQKPIQWKQVWNWFQNRRHAQRAKVAKTPDNDKTVGTDVGTPPTGNAVPTAVQSTDRKAKDVQWDFEAKSVRDGAWYDVSDFISKRQGAGGEQEVRVRFSGFGAEEDEWVNIATAVRQRSLPCETTECVAVLPGDLILCFQEGNEQALYFDADILDVQRRRHDVRGCRCRFWVRYRHDQTEEVVPLRKVCRRPETEQRLQQAKEKGSATVLPTKTLNAAPTTNIMKQPQSSPVAPATPVTPAQPSGIANNTHLATTSPQVLTPIQQSTNTQEPASLRAITSPEASTSVPQFSVQVSVPFKSLGLPMSTFHGSTEVANASHAGPVQVQHNAPPSTTSQEPSIIATAELTAAPTLALEGSTLPHIVDSSSHVNPMSVTDANGMSDSAHVVNVQEQSASVPPPAAISTAITPFTEGKHVVNEVFPLAASGVPDNTGQVTIPSDEVRGIASAAPTVASEGSTLAQILASSSHVNTMSVTDTNGISGSAHVIYVQEQLASVPPPAAISTTTTPFTEGELVVNEVLPLEAGGVPGFTGEVTVQSAESRGIASEQ